MLNPNPVVKLIYHVRILRKLKLNVPKRILANIHYAIMAKVIFF